ncbi:hypothetical protein HAX54_002024 [Datura stramonium]|uniref:Uncharacterized protein n=1 Tax=Datura stramonium TaxID=4076 RepID=A0ABS8T393_DATST|nr:hypothetical protein [Datura stramonium]
MEIYLRVLQRANQNAKSGEGVQGRVLSTLTFVKCIDDHSKSTCNSRCNGPMENNCSLEHPCYYWITDEKGSEESPFMYQGEESKLQRILVNATVPVNWCFHHNR